MHRSRLIMLIGIIAPVAACDVAPVEPLLPGAPSARIENAFNPQPEPPASLLQFELQGQLDGRWTGRYQTRAGEVGSIDVEPIASRENGLTLRLVQSWTIHPPDPVAPVEATLQGVLILATGRLVLQGMTADGVPVHVQGQVVSGPGGVSIGGELMFNPQPEPPAR